MSNRSKSPKPELIDKERKAIELRRAGYTFDEIARNLGYKTPQGAYLAYHRALKRTLIKAGTEEARATEIDRLDRLQRGIWATAVAGNPQAVSAVLKLMDRRAKLLGLDAPTKIQQEVTVYEGGSDIDREVQRLAELLATGGRVTGDVATPVSETGTVTA